ncbi:MAG: NAD(P)/FAD-dependent oxidoreductase [Myxococcota bacterium]|nr:NAD(P)/FAD-dependent oxidoreductase [Myxococcota bacterium]
MVNDAASIAVAIVGAGFSGLAMGIRLKEAEIHDFVILEKAERVGGTWRDNHYPGAACDVESLLYSFSFEPWPARRRAFAAQHEILSYLEACAAKYGLLPHIRFGQKVKSASFDEGAGVWAVCAEDVHTGERRTTRARALVSAPGGLSRPAYPDIPGLASFQGKTMHSARWDDDYRLEGKRVAVIGTGASSVQIVPSIAPCVERLHVFQRTPPWVVPKGDRFISRRARWLFRCAPLVQSLARASIYWRNELFGVGFVADSRLMWLPQRVALRHLERSVRDAALRARLTPNYVIGCKRILPSDDYYPALQRPNVELVTDRIREISRRGVVTQKGTGAPCEHLVDALVLATGFQAAEGRPIPLYGRDGRELSAVWRGRGAEAYLGTTVAGFPNAFFIVGPNTGLGHTSMLIIIESQVDYIIDCLRYMSRHDVKLIDVRADVQARYNKRLQDRLARAVWSTGGCMSWYTTRKGRNTTLWPGFASEFRLRTRRFKPADYDLAQRFAGTSLARPAGI